MRRSNEPRIYGPYKHGDQWRVHVVTGSGGGRKTTYRGYPTRDLAEAAVNGAKSQALGTTVMHAVNAVLQFKRDEGLAKTTIETDEYRLWHFFNLAENQNRPLRWLKNRGAELYAAARRDRSPDTHHAELALAKQVGALCVKNRWLRENPFEGIETVGRKTHGSEKVRLGVDESRVCFDYCLRHAAVDQWAVLTLGYLLLGTRASELVRRDVSDLDDGGRLLRIKKAKTKAGERKLVIPDELHGPLMQLVEGRLPSAPIFTKENGAKATRYGAYHHVKRIVKAATGIDASPQALRRTASDVATDAGELGATIARHLGQKSERVTNRSYRSASAVENARIERGLRVIAGGKK